MKHTTCQQQKYKVHKQYSAIFPVVMHVIVRCIQFFYSTNDYNQQQSKVPAVPRSKILDTNQPNLLAITRQPHQKLIPALQQFHCHFYTLPIDQHLSAVVNKEASSHSFKARSQQTNSTLKHSRSILYLSFSVSHSLTLIFSSFFHLRNR